MRRRGLGIMAMAGLVLAYGPAVEAQSPTPVPVQSFGPILAPPIPAMPSPLITPSPLGGGGGGPTPVPNDPQSPGAGPVQGEETSPVGRRPGPSVLPMPGPSPS